VEETSHLPFFVQRCFCRSAFENQNLLWSDVTGQASALPENFPRKPEVIYADKNVLKLRQLIAGLLTFRDLGFLDGPHIGL
jgi:hypothetical protein